MSLIENPVPVLRNAFPIPQDGTLSQDTRANLWPVWRKIGEELDPIAVFRKQTIARCWE